AKSRRQQDLCPYQTWSTPWNWRGFNQATILHTGVADQRRLPCKPVDPTRVRRLTAVLALQDHRMDTDRRFWLKHAVWPLLLFFMVAATAATTSLDESIERAWAFNAQLGRFIGTGPGEWWARELIHGAGGSVMRGLGALLLLSWVATLSTETL